MQTKINNNLIEYYNKAIAYCRENKLGFALNPDEKNIAIDFSNICLQNAFNWLNTKNTFFKQCIALIQSNDKTKNLMELCQGNYLKSFFAGYLFSKYYQNDLRHIFTINQIFDKEDFANFQTLFQNNIDKIRSRMNKIIADILKKIEEIQALQTINYSNEGLRQNQFINLGENLEIANKLTSNPYFVKIIEMAGRMQRTANKVLKTKTNHRNEEIIGLETGNEIQKILPQEITLFTDVDTSTYFIKKFQNKELLQYQERGKEEQDTGPIILCIDQSGSIQGKASLFGNAFAFGMFLIAQTKNRPFYVIKFDHDVVDKEIKNNQELLRFLECFLGGNTNFVKPLKRSMEIINSNQKFKLADIIFITDGLSYIPQNLLQEIKRKKEEISFKIIGLQIGQNTNVLNSFCDKVFCFTKLDGIQSEEFLKETFSIGA